MPIEPFIDIVEIDLVMERAYGARNLVRQTILIVPRIPQRQFAFRHRVDYRLQPALELNIT